MTEGSKNMSATIKVVPTAEVATAEHLRAAATEMEEAAWREGIDAAAPLGVFVRAMHRTILIMAEIAERQADGVVKTVRDAMHVAEAEAVKARKANELAYLAVEAARTAHASFEVQKDQVFGKLVSTIVPQLVKAVGEAVVIRERLYNARVQWGRAAGIAAAAGCLLLGGYVWGGRLPDNAAIAGAMALERIRQCQAAPVRDDRTHEAFCPMKALLAPA